MHPLIEDISEMKIPDLEAKVSELGRKYFMTSNESVRHQISLLLSTYQSELSKKRNESLKQLLDTKNRGLDKLINID